MPAEQEPTKSPLIYLIIIFLGFLMCIIGCVYLGHWMTINSQPKNLQCFAPLSLTEVN